MAINEVKEAIRRPLPTDNSIESTKDSKPSKVTESYKSSEYPQFPDPASPITISLMSI